VDWVQWLALVGGLVAAAAFVVGRRDVSRADAARVYAIVSKYRYGLGKEPIFTTFKVVNDSAAPALQVGVSAWDWGRRRRAWRLRRHEQWMTGRRIHGNVFSTIEPNSSTKEHDLPGLTSYAGQGGESPPIMLVFRDGQGRRWVRWPDGKLTTLYPSVYYFQDRRWRRQRERRAALVEQRFREREAQNREQASDEG
jgi:hypothetical protein